MPGPDRGQHVVAKPAGARRIRVRELRQPRLERLVQAPGHHRVAAERGDLQLERPLVLFALGHPQPERVEILAEGPEDRVQPVPRSGIPVDVGVQALGIGRIELLDDPAQLAEPGRERAGRRPSIRHPVGDAGRDLARRQDVRGAHVREVDEPLTHRGRAVQRAGDVREECRHEVVDLRQDAGRDPVRWVEDGILGVWAAQLDASSPPSLATGRLTSARPFRRTPDEPADASGGVVPLPAWASCPFVPFGEVLLVDPLRVSGDSAPRAMSDRAPACWMTSARAAVTPCAPLSTVKLLTWSNDDAAARTTSGRFSAICWAMTASWFWLSAAARRSMPGASASIRARMASASAVPLARIASASAWPLRRVASACASAWTRIAAAAASAATSGGGRLGVQADLLGVGLGLADPRRRGRRGERRLAVGLGVGGLAHVDLELLLLLLAPGAPRPWSPP